MDNALAKVGSLSITQASAISHNTLGTTGLEIGTTLPVVSNAGTRLGMRWVVLGGEWRAVELRCGRGFVAVRGGD